MRELRDDQDIAEVVENDIASRRKPKDIAWAEKIMENSAKRHRVGADFVELRDWSFGEHASHHNAIKREQSIYFANARKTGTGHPAGGTIGNLTVHTNEILNNKVFEVTHAVQTRLSQGSPKAYLEATDETHGDAVDGVQGFLDDYNDADDDLDNLDTQILQITVGGISAVKTMWNMREDRLTCKSVNPLMLAVDPECFDVSFDGAGFVIESSQRRYGYLRHRYPHWNPRRLKRHESPRRKWFRTDEIWMEPWYAEEEFGIKSPSMLRAVLVDGTLVFLGLSPFWFRGFPYVCGRGFKHYDANGDPNVFWGFGYPRILSAQQKVLDEVIAQILLILQNQGLGQFLMLKGAMGKNKRMRRRPGEIYEIDPEIMQALGATSLRDILEQIPPSDVPASLFQFLLYVEGTMEGNTGISAVFSGQEPQGNASGRAINLLQSAATAHIADLQRSLLGMKKRLARNKVALVQQLGGMPTKPQQWRAGLPKREFNPFWRHVPVRIRIQDASSLPHTLQGKLELGMLLMDKGLLSPETFYDMTEIDRAYGFEREENTQGAIAQIQQMIGGTNAAPNQSTSNPA